MAAIPMDAARLATHTGEPSLITKFFRGIVWSLKFRRAHQELMRMSMAERREYDLTDAKIVELAMNYANSEIVSIA